MNVLRTTSGYAHRIYIARLDPKELGLSDNELITLADNHGQPGPACHFGGTVERRKGRRSAHTYARIKVYTD